MLWLLSSLALATPLTEDAALRTSGLPATADLLLVDRWQDGALRPPDQPEALARLLAHYDETGAPDALRRLLAAEARLPEHDTFDYHWATASRYAEGSQEPQPALHTGR